MRPLLVGAVAAAFTVASPAMAEFKIRAARIAEGDLWVMGEVDEPNTAITLDETYTERTDSRGRFQFRTAYHPATCTVLLKTARQARAVVIADCGQRGPAGPEGPPGPPAFRGLSAPTEPERQEPVSLPVSCSRRAALYVAPNGFQVWVTRKGVIRYANTATPAAARQEVVLQVSIGGDVASLHGSDYRGMLRGGPPQEIEASTGQLINWERLVDTLPTAIQISSESSPEVVAELTFKECGSAPVRKPVPSPRRDAGPPAAQGPGESPPMTRPLPQGALPGP
jgi:hypothetical protein